MIMLLVWIILVIIIAAALLSVVRALLATPVFASVAPYANLIYALVVLLVIIIAIQFLFGGVTGLRNG